MIYKKVLHERKRHTDCRVASPGRGVWTDRWTDTCENITLPHPSDAFGNNLQGYTYDNCGIRLQNQWQIQDFTEEGATTSQAYYLVTIGTILIPSHETKVQFVPLF